MGKTVVSDLNDFLKNCANIIADQYGFDDDDEVRKILADCLPKEFVLTDELSVNVDGSSPTLDYTTAINSIKNIFKPNFVQALMWMEPADAFDLFQIEKKTDLCYGEHFFKTIYPTTLLFSTSVIRQQAEKYSDFLKKYKHQFLKNGFFTNVFEGQFWLPSFLTGSLEDANVCVPRRISYLEERQRKLVDPDWSHVKWHNFISPMYDDTFTTSLVLPSEARKKLGRFISEDWFIEEETLLREKIFSLYYKTTLMIADSDVGADLVEKYLRLIERTFTLPELELFFGVSARYFSFPLSDIKNFKFKYGKDFILTSVQFLSFFTIQDKRDNLLSKSEKAIKSIIPRDSVRMNLFEAIQTAGGFDLVKKVVAESKNIENEVIKANSLAKSKVEKLEELVTQQYKLNPTIESQDRFIPVVINYSRNDHRPKGPCFSENFDVFYPANSKFEPLYFTHLQRKLVEFLMREGATDPLRAVTKLQILNELYNKKYARLIPGISYEDLDTEEKKLLKEFRKYRLDLYVFKNSPAWKLGFIRSDERNLYNMAKYWLDFEYSKKKASQLRGRRKSPEKKKIKKK